MSTQRSTENSGLTRRNAVVVGLCLLINVVEGFDVLVMAFAASGVAGEWTLDESAIGLLLSAGLVGMAVGSVVIAPLADRFGRRPVTTLALVLCGLGMMVAAVSTDPVMLGSGRVLTGLGVGATVASLPVIIIELTPKRWRGSMIALYAAGLPAGGILGGAIAALLISGHGWRAPFVVGAVLTVILAVAVIVAMPESQQYRQRGRAADGRGIATRSILDRKNAAPTVLLWLSYFVLMGGFYFAASWTPRLLEQSGYTGEQGLSAGVLLNLGGLVGTLLFGVLALRASRRTLSVAAFFCCGLAFLAMTFALGSLLTALAAAVAIGLFVNACAAGLHSIGPELYSAPVRATGMGWAMGIGRVGALTAPILAGVLLDNGWSPASLFRMLAWPMVAAALAVLLMAARARTNAAPSQPAPAAEPHALIEGGYR
ncbi:aromatic acid/H+ symport family MFS transporter [Mycobacterium sp. 21AC1]|uniref:MFS transporter n=1 Tax=[Mycobacterium] appelbergii TaxID=2939269 RepID=UPI002938E6D4|nr:aromatic acid/H+ symport family MFS transporter [Mycobacterium sp. 21AC1]MDV3130248.1 aromatic acid/H+ symport family MFS transporter [Mycobacterium sp. 21AC1]